jgi:hypothetical protein
MCGEKVNGKVVPSYASVDSYFRFANFPIENLTGLKLGSLYPVGMNHDPDWDLSLGGILVKVGSHSDMSEAEPHSHFLWGIQ